MITAVQRERDSLLSTILTKERTDQSNLLWCSDQPLCMDVSVSMLVR
ncbi:hypothetical protein ABGM23_004795 [Escherichia albertii]|nr:hypothetical protein [Escherichia albertii]MCU7272984.1 hypothetical protein [Escherichia albertii]WDB45736.1 hypothetical protein PS031_22835 [Escherichia albertii]